MKRSVFALVFAMVFGALCAVGDSAPAFAQPGPAQESLAGILANIRRQAPGQLSDVQPARGPEGQPYYRVKWLTPDGRILWFVADARTGEIISVVGDEGGARGNNRGRGNNRDRD